MNNNTAAATTTAGNENGAFIDEGLYSRQLYNLNFVEFIITSLLFLF